MRSSLQGVFGAVVGVVVVGCSASSAAPPLHHSDPGDSVGAGGANGGPGGVGAGGATTGKGGTTSVPAGIVCTIDGCSQGAGGASTGGSAGGGMGGAAGMAGKAGASAAGGGSGTGGASGKGGTGGTSGMGGAGGTSGKAGTGGGGASGASSGSGGSSGSAGAGGGTATGAVVPYYPVNGAFWNDYVKADVASGLPKTDVACDPVNGGPTYAGCRHAGEIRAYAVMGQSMCSGLSAGDSLSAFDWTCVEQGGQAVVVSTGLKTGKRLADLIDMASGAWKANSVVVSDAGGPVSTSASAVWWSNPILQVPAFASTAKPHDIYLAAPTGNYSITGDKIGFVVDPASTFAGSLKILGSFAWIEGPFSGMNGYAVSLQQGGFGVVRNVSTKNAGGGVQLITMRASTVTDLTTDTTSTQLAGLSVKSSQGMTVARVTATGGFPGIETDKVSGSSFEDLAGTGGLRTIQVLNTTTSTFKRLTSTDSIQWGIYVATGNVDLTLEDLTVRSAGDIGIEVDSTHCRFRRLRVLGAKGNGLKLSSASGPTAAFDNVLEDVFLSDTGRNGNIALSLSNYNVLNGVRVFGAGVSAVLTGGRNLRLANVITAGAKNALDLSEATNEAIVIQNVTAADARKDPLVGGTGMGVVVRGGSQKSVFNVLSVNSEYGFYQQSMSSHVMLARNVVSVGSQQEALGLGINAKVAFEGVLTLGSNLPTSVCVAGAGSLGVDGNCTATGSSSAVITTDASSAGVLVGPVTGDAANTSDDAAGQTPYATTMDLDAFENTERGWGRTAQTPWPSVDQQGRCAAGDTCQIIDFSLRATDTLAREIVPNLPSGDDVVVGEVLIGTGLPPKSQAECDASAVGSAFVSFGTTPATCEIRYLRDAVEILSDGIGDDDNLCESGETCLFSPNAGAYQGHGNLVSAGAFVDGQLTGITLVRYEINGRLPVRGHAHVRDAQAEPGVAALHLAVGSFTPLVCMCSVISFTRFFRSSADRLLMKLACV